MTNWFKDFEGRPVRSKDQIPWRLTKELEIQGDYLISHLSALPKIEEATDSELLSTAQYCSNLVDWVEQMRIMGYTGLPIVIEEILEEKFGNRHLIADLQKAYTEAWLHNKSGQHEIGVNHFSIHDGKLYYSTLESEWYEVDTATIFKITPTLSGKADGRASEKVGADYKPSRYHQIYMDWSNAVFSNEQSPIASQAKEGQTNPEVVLADTINKIHATIERPPSLAEIEKITSDKPGNLEYLIKISCLVADFAQQRRMADEHSLYLLRDCAMFHEAQILLDYFDGRQTSHDQIYLGRQSLSSKSRDAGHWYLCQELLLNSLQKFPNDFAKFYADFSEHLQEYEEYSSEFAELVRNIAEYLENHIHEAKQANRIINVIDLGFQGSINMLVKYVLDRYCLNGSGATTRIHMYVVAEWFKGIYSGMYSSNVFSALTDIEVMSRNNAIYEYVAWSLKDGHLAVKYGDGTSQIQADLELTVMTMTILFATSRGLLNGASSAS